MNETPLSLRSFKPFQKDSQSTQVHFFPENILPREVWRACPITKTSPIFVVKSCTLW